MLKRYVAQMYNISDAAHQRFTHEVLKAKQFLALANNRFASVHFSIISALGAAPDDRGQTGRERSNPGGSWIRFSGPSNARCPKGNNASIRNRTQKPLQGAVLALC